MDSCQTLVHQFKFNQYFLAGRTLARLFAERIAEKPNNIDLIIPMPQHPLRLLTRGFNQANFLAKTIHSTLDIPLANQLCRRRHFGKPIHKLKKQERIQLCPNDFKVKGLPRHSRVAIVDDVLTTGATANAFATALRHAGAAHVELWVIARTSKTR